MEYLSEFKNQSGIYMITNKINSKVYVGSTHEFIGRWRTHRSLLNRNEHFNKHLQASWNKYGSENFELSVLEVIDMSLHDDIYLTERESYYIQLYKSTDRKFGYNTIADTVTNSGYKWNEESRKKYSEYRKQHIVKEAVEALNKYSEERKGKSNIAAIEWYQNLSEEEKIEYTKKRVEGRKRKAEERGYWNSEETYKKIVVTKKERGQIKTISLYNLDGTLYHIYDSYTDCLKTFGDSIKNSASLQNCIKTGKLYHGYLVSYSVENIIPEFELIQEKVLKNKNNRIYFKKDLENNIIDKFSKTQEAAISVGLTKMSNQMTAAFKTRKIFKNYYWEIVEPYDRSTIGINGGFGVNSNWEVL